MKGFIRLFLSVALLGTGFLIGTAWNPQPSAPQTEETPHPQNVHQTDDETPPGAAANDPDDGLSELEKATINLFERSAPSVVFINTSRVQMDFWYRNAVEVPQGSGTGFVWDLDGHIVTNFHVIKDADRAQVTLSNGKTYDASLVGGAPDKDLAVLRIEAPESELTPIPVGSSDHLMVGQSVLAIGNPFGLDQTLTTGIISALGREIKSVSGLPIRGVIQTDAAINPGNSGGPLLNSSGRLIGVNTAIYSPSGAYAGIGFSIPVDVVKWVVPELIKYGRIKRPKLGVELATPQVMRRLGIEGALVINVVRGSGADKAGIRPTLQDRYGRIQLGDIIVEVAGQKVASMNDLKLILENYKAGDVVPVVVLREDERVELSVQLSE